MSIVASRLRDELERAERDGIIVAHAPTPGDTYLSGYYDALRFAIITAEATAETPA